MIFNYKFESFISLYSIEIFSSKNILQLTIIRGKTLRQCSFDLFENLKLHMDENKITLRSHGRGIRYADT